MPENELTNLQRCHKPKRNRAVRGHGHKQVSIPCPIADIPISTVGQRKLIDDPARIPHLSGVAAYII